MFSAKATAILLIAAIFNPLCCCLNLFAGELESQATSPAEMHSCCTEAGVEDDAKQERSQLDCPHETEKDSKINESASPHGSLAKAPQSLLSVLFFLDVPIPAPSARSAPASYADSAPLPPSSPLSQTYCVYIL